MPREDLIWQDPVPEVDHGLVGSEEVRELRRKILDSGLSTRDMVYTAWSSAATFRGQRLQGGRRQRGQDTPGTHEELGGERAREPCRVLGVLESVRNEFNGQMKNGIRISMADLIVLAGNVAVEEAARAAGYNISIPFVPGRTDARQEQTDVNNIAVLEPRADGFRNYRDPSYMEGVPDEFLLVDRANLLTLSVPEMAVLVGGIRVLGAVHANSGLGVFTSRPGVLTNDFFVNLLDMGIEWRPTSELRTEFEGIECGSGKLLYRASRVDLVFGSHSELRAVSEVYASKDGGRSS